MALPSPPDLRFADGCAEDVLETHISWVFLAGERAYKLTKPVVLPFLDSGTAARVESVVLRARIRDNPAVAETVIGRS
jgi:aminoglycoside phosphotransferase family enzyme